MRPPDKLDCEERLAEADDSETNDAEEGLAGSDVPLGKPGVPSTCAPASKPRKVMAVCQLDLSPPEPERFLRCMLAFTPPDGLLPAKGVLTFALPASSTTRPVPSRKRTSNFVLSRLMDGAIYEGLESNRE